MSDTHFLILLGAAILIAALQVVALLRFGFTSMFASVRARMASEG